MVGGDKKVIIIVTTKHELSYSQIALGTEKIVRAHILRHHPSELP
ncbi:hypothetical protein [uncultured Duncaniella sp.]|nr:hypothetical protein [uncultured Duncaniella sp.]